ncbi:MAG TPA: GNAT family N-acetyltransferase [Acidimicrobiia bacterium]|nr:GNAT family N-acetyltransferase [Acidimicrobiia bacterium]
MRVSARRAEMSDMAILEGLYRGLETEMSGIHPMWPLADGLSEPVPDSLRQALSDEATTLLIGEIEGYPFGFLMARVEGLLPQAGGEEVCSIRLVFVEPEAREVSVGEVMRDLVMEQMRARGVTKFDAHVLPGHRLVKNFFEAGGFSARSIVMHHDDERD